MKPINSPVMLVCRTIFALAIASWLLSANVSLAADLPATTKDNYNITMNDGTVFVGAIQTKKVTFKASYGETDVSLGDIVSFGDGFLILNDGSKLKGVFSNGSLTIETARGEMNLPFDSITAIAKPLPVVNTPTATPIASVALLKEDSSKAQGLRIGMEYRGQRDAFTPYPIINLYSSRVYLFKNSGVFVYQVVSREGDIFLDKRNQKIGWPDGFQISGGHPKGTVIAGLFQVLFGPGDKVPVLEDAPYKVEGTSVYIDWGQGHTKFFDVGLCGSDTEVFTIKNDGLILESATFPGFNLTVNISAVAGIAGESSQTIEPKLSTSNSDALKDESLPKIEKTETAPQPNVIPIVSSEATAVTMPAGTATTLLYPAVTGGRWGFVNKSGETVINPQFERAQPFSEGLAGVRTGGRWGFIGENGKFSINPQFDAVKNFVEGMAPVQLGRRWGFINPAGKFVINPQFDDAACFTNGVARVKLGAQFGYINASGVFVNNPTH